MATALALTSALVGLPSARAQAGPDVTVRVFRQEIWPGPDLCRLYTEGLVVNNGPGLAGKTTVIVSALAPGGAELGRGQGSSWLGVLAPGEEGPFSAATSLFDCEAEIAETAFLIEAAAADRDRYRPLEPRRVFLRQTEAGNRLYGEIVNTGAQSLNAGDVGSRVYVGFFLGEDVVELAAAKLPVVNIAGRVGQAHAPGYGLPWFVVPPPESYDRWRVWAIGTPFPEGVYPIPLGTRDLTVDALDDGVRLTAELYSCGVAAAEDIVAVAVSRAPDGGVARFGLFDVKNEAALAPAEAIQVSFDWLGLGPGVRTDMVELHPFALQSQGSPSGLVPCSRLAASIALAWLLNDG